MPELEPQSNIRVSVCMATYRGAEFVREQIESILGQLGDDDEIVVVDDASPDSTAEIVASITDPRVVLHRAPVNRGYVRTFETALELARGDYLLLSDQDDVWPPGRLDVMMRSLDEAQFVAGNYSVLGGDVAPPTRRPLEPSFDGETARNVFGVLIGYRPYFGCAMGMRRSALKLVLPIPPSFNESHDLWIALVANAAHELKHRSEVVVQRRLHDNNVTPLGWRPLCTILRARLMLARGFLIAVGRVRRRATRS